MNEDNELKEYSQEETDEAYAELAWDLARKEAEEDPEPW